MKVLVAAGGTSWESPVDHRFESAAWYLLIDTTSGEKEVYQNLPPHDHGSILVVSSQAHVSVVVTGWVNSSTARLMQSLNLRLAVAHNARVRDAVKMLSEGELAMADLASFRQGLVMPDVIRPGSPVSVRKDSKHAGSKGSPGNTPRGHHHLQQYGGRGH